MNEDVPTTRLRIGRWLPEYVPPDPIEDEPGGAPDSTDLPAYLLQPPVNRRWRTSIAGLTAVGTVVLLVVVVMLSPEDRRSGSVGGPSAVATRTGDGGAVANPSTRAGFGTVDVPSPTPAPATASATTSATAGPSRKPNPGARPPDGTEPLTVGTRVSLEPMDADGYRVRHRDFAGRIDPIGPTSSTLARADATFTIRSGLANPECVTFEAVNYPGRFLRHQNFAIFLHRDDGSRLFAADATFCPGTGLAGQFTSFRSYNYPGRYLRHRADKLYLDPVDDGGRTRQEMTYAVSAGLFG